MAVLFKKNTPHDPAAGADNIGSNASWKPYLKATRQLRFCDNRSSWHAIGPCSAGGMACRLWTIGCKLRFLT